MNRKNNILFLERLADLLGEENNIKLLDFVLDDLIFEFHRSQYLRDLADEEFIPFYWILRRWFKAWRNQF